MSLIEPISVRARAPRTLELPPAHLELVWRPLVPADGAALHALLNAVEVADQSHYRTGPEEVTEIFEGAWKDTAQDTLGGFDDTGALRAWAYVEVRPGDTSTVRAFLSGGVHPQWRGRGIGRAVLTWAEGRGRQKLAESGKDVPARLAAYVEEKDRDHRRLYAAAGFSPVRWYTGMRRDLSRPLPDVSLPGGIQVVGWSPDLDDAVRSTHNEAFADHWGSEPQTPESWRHQGTHRVPGWSFVALAGEGTAAQVVGYVVSSRYEHDWDATGYTSGHTDLLGVLRPWRGQRVAQALLARSMAAYRADGMAYATLGVDDANPTGARGLYERLGYEVTHGEVLYSVEL